MQTSKLKYNWHMLDRKTISSFVQSLAPELVNTPLTVTQFHSKLTRHLKKLAPLRFRKTTSVKVEFNQAWTGGTYYSDWDQHKQKCIELLFVYPEFTTEFSITKRRFAGMCTTIADTVLHEIIHMRQYRRRDFKILPEYASTAEKTQQRQEQIYLGCPDEIDAYAFNIACELLDKFSRDHTLVVAYLNENQQGKRRRHNSWRMYLKAFQHDHNHPIIKRLKKRVIRYLPYAEIGKPYRSTDWINR